MKKLKKCNKSWYLVDTALNPKVNSNVLFNGQPTVVSLVDVENKLCIIEFVGMSKNTGFETVEVIIDRIDEIDLNDFLTEVSRVEVIDEKGRSYVKYLSNQKASFSFQDDDRTLKVFIDEKNKSE